MGVLALIAAVALVAGACEGPPARSKPWRHAPDPEAPANGVAGPRPAAGTGAAGDARLDHTLRIRLEAEPSHLNPILDPEREELWVAGDTIFESLVRYEPPRPGAPAELAPGLADSWRVTDGGRVIRFWLHPGVQFHDGHPFSAIDAQFSVDWMRSPRLSRVPILRQALADIEAVEMWGPRDLRIVLRKPNGYLLRALAAVPILPAHVYGQGEARRSRGQAPIGTGPFKLAAWDKGKRIVLARNEDYWGTKPELEEVQFLVEPDGAKALTAAKQGQIDLVPSLIPQHYPDQLDAPGIRDAFQRLDLRPPRFRAVVVHTAKPPFDDLRVREAAALLIDRERIAREAQGGLARPIGGPIWPGGPVDGEADPPLPTDPDRAAALLEEAGWHRIKEGVRERNGERMHVSLLVTNDARGDLERDLIVTAWRRGGIVVEPLPGDPAVILNRLRAHTFHAGLLEWRGLADGDLSPLLSSKGAENWGELASPTIDAALEALEAAPDADARRALAPELSAALAAERPLLPLTAPDPHGVIHRRVQDVVIQDGWIVIRRVRLGAAPR